MVHGNPGNMCFLGALGFGTWGISLCASTLLSRLDAPDTLHDHHECWVSQQTKFCHKRSKVGRMLQLRFEPPIYTDGPAEFAGARQNHPVTKDSATEDID